MGLRARVVRGRHSTGQGVGARVGLGVETGGSRVGTCSATKSKDRGVHRIDGLIPLRVFLAEQREHCKSSRQDAEHANEYRRWDSHCFASYFATHNTIWNGVWVLLGAVGSSG
jgi:hypothetical protein